MPKTIKIPQQKTTLNNSGTLIQIREGLPDTVSTWKDAYFHFEVTTAPSSQKIQKLDIDQFIQFMIKEEGSDNRINWTPRLSKAFQTYLRNENRNGKRRWGDRTINRILAHLKTFAKWIHKLRPFPLSDPMGKIKLFSVGSGLEIERAITPGERRRILDAADLLLEIGGRSKDRNRYRKAERPKRKGYRPARNRAIVYLLIETGIRRQAVTLLNVGDVDIDKSVIRATEKGGVSHDYQISREGLSAIQRYLTDERTEDFTKWQSPALFLPAGTRTQSKGRFNVKMINNIWQQVCEMAGVKGKTPHSARHAMGKHIIEKTGNIAAVQRQLGHKNAVYSMQYARITAKELKEVIEDRE